jgi:hypothetical protein
MNYIDYKNYFSSLHPVPEKPYLRQYIFRADLILLILAALGGVIFSASRTFTLIAEQSGSTIAAFAVLALEFSLAGLILGSSHRNQGKFMNFMRSSAMWITVFLLLMILIVTNASYEIKQVGLLLSDQAVKVVLVLFLGVMIPILVVINLENLATRIPEYTEEFKQAQAKYYHELAMWNVELAESWEEEQDKELAEDKPVLAYSKEERREFIREQLSLGKKLNKSKLAQKFGVSTTTIINDIRELTPPEKSKIESQF